MNLIPPFSDKSRIEYPDKDGRPRSDNTLQFQWIVTIKEGLEAVFRDEPNVFVAGDLLWFPVEGDPTIRTAPDTMVVFGRPKGHRGSYRQWREDGIAPQVVFDVRASGSGCLPFLRRYLLCKEFGVEEYYIYEVDAGELTGWCLQAGKLRWVKEINGWVSPRMKIRFEQRKEGELLLHSPDGRNIYTCLESVGNSDRAEQPIRIRDEPGQ